MVELATADARATGCRSRGHKESASLLILHAFSLTILQLFLGEFERSAFYLEMAFGIGRGMTAPLAVINFILYFISACLAGSILNHNLDGDKGYIGE
jgi:hypothetical protein